MENFEFSYDQLNDDLFLYLKEKHSSRSIELGNFILDFDDKGNLVAMQITNMQEVFSKLFLRKIDISKLKEVKLNLINFRNIQAIHFYLSDNISQEKTTLLIPHITQRSPILNF
jgi:uncharacterized protein YuzE